jgi:hypothetical protein
MTGVAAYMSPLDRRRPLSLHSRHDPCGLHFGSAPYDVQHWSAQDQVEGYLLSTLRRDPDAAGLQNRALELRLGEG